MLKTRPPLDTTDGLALIMPMAAAGVRFTREGRKTPKPLILLNGRPLFVWAAESVRQAAPVEEMVFVVLSEHIRDHAIDKAIERHYPQARLVVLDAPAASVAETAALGVRELRSTGPFAINDSDQAFQAKDLASLVAGLKAGAEGALLGFASDDSDGAYVRLNDAGEVAGTAKTGPYAIASCALFGGRDGFLARVARHRAAHPRQDLLIGDLFDAMAREGARILFQPLARHVPFGAPEGLAAIDPDDLDFLTGGRSTKTAS